jgi:hypothetical protein
LLAAICEALDLPLSELLHLVATDVGVVDEVTAPSASATVSAGAGRDKRIRADAESAMQGGRVVPAVVGNDLADLRLQPVLRHQLSTSLSQPGGGVVVAA